MMNLAEYRRATTQLADFLPWAAMVDEGVVLNKDGSFQRTAKFRGPDLDSAVPAELVGEFEHIFHSGASLVNSDKTEAAAQRMLQELPEEENLKTLVIDAFFAEQFSRRAERSYEYKLTAGPPLAAPDGPEELGSCKPRRRILRV